MIRRWNAPVMECQWGILMANLRVHHQERHLVHNQELSEDPMLVSQVGSQDSGGVHGGFL